MIEGEFQNSVRSEAVGFSHGDFGLVVQALYSAAGNQLLRPKVVEDELPAAVPLSSAADSGVRLQGDPPPI